MIMNAELQKVMMAAMLELNGCALAEVMRHGDNALAAMPAFWELAARVGLKITHDLKNVLPLGEEDLAQMLAGFCGAFVTEFANARRVTLATARQLNDALDKLAAVSDPAKAAAQAPTSPAPSP